MKKKAVLIISVLLLLCIGITTFSGCFLFRVSRHKKLKLTQVYQLTDGDIAFDIANTDVIDEWDAIEFSFDNGDTWQKASGRLGYYYYKTKESDYGKEYKIVVRIAADFDKRASRKSNTINYVVKVPNKFTEAELGGFWASLEDVPQEGDYKFIADNGTIKLKRYYKENDGSILLRDVENNDRICIEYKFLDKKGVDEEFAQSIKEYVETDEFKAMLQDESQLPNIIEMVAVFSYYSEASSKKFDNWGWTDYNYDKYISNDEYAQSIITGFDYDFKSIYVVGALVFMLVRIKENDTILRSDTFIVKCWL